MFQTVSATIATIAILASGHIPSAIIPFETDSNGIKAEGVQIDYIDGSSEFSDRVTTPYTVRTESAATLPESVSDSRLNEADTVSGIIVECHHTRDWTGNYKVLTEDGELISIDSDPEDLISSDTVTMYYENGELICIRL